MSVHGTDTKLSCLYVFIGIHHTAFSVHPSHATDANTVIIITSFATKIISNNMYVRIVCT